MADLPFNLPLRQAPSTGSAGCDPSQRIRQHALSLGFDAVGIAVAAAAPHAEFFARFISAGRQGEMKYLARNRAAREDIRSRLPWAKSVVSLATSYNVAPPTPAEFSIARYAAGDDYHELIEGRLAELGRFIEQIPVCRAGTGRHDGPVRWKGYVDTGPILERDYAALAGIGWIGKNTNLISGTLGSYVFLSEVVTSLDLPPDGPQPDRCGSCRKCIDACPTGAIREPYTVDANRCVAYLTVEKRGSFTDEEAAMIGTRLVGCDVCQEVCPWNRKAPPASEKRFAARPWYDKITLQKIAEMDEDEFARWSGRSAIRRVTLEGLRRNALAVARNLGQETQ